MSPPPFQTFLVEHRAEVHRFLRAMVGPHDADDCFQETFLAALRAYPDLRDASNLRSWVMTIAYRKALDLLRGRARHAVPVRELPEDDGGGEIVLPDDGLWAAVAELPDKQRAAVAHRYGADLSYEEIALILNCSPDAARRSAYEGIKKLRERVETV